MRHFSLRCSVIVATLAFASPSFLHPLEVASAHAKPKKRGGARKAIPAAPAAEVSEAAEVPSPDAATAAAPATPTVTPVPSPTPAVETTSESVPAPAETATPAVDEAAAADQKLRDDHQATVEQLRARYDELRDAVFRSRARRETLEKALFSTKFLATIAWDANRNFSLDKAELRLDGTRIWETGERPIGDDPVVLTERSLPPGPHVLGIRIEVHSRDNPRLGYTSEQSYTLVFPEGKKTEVEITVDEDGDLPSYNPDIEIEIDTE
jgi:hypothetical protein